MTAIQMDVIWMIIAYMLIIGFLCFISTRSTHNLSDYVLGGRRLSGPVVAMGACASDMSSWLVLALPAVAWMWGWRAELIPVGLLIGAYFNWHYVARRLRVYTELLQDALTVPDYLVRRFDDNKGFLRGMSALIVLIFFTGYVASGFVGASVIIQQIFGITYHHALCYAVIVFTVYTIFGGFLAISWVDFFQGALVFFGVVMLVLFLMHLFPIAQHVESFVTRAQSPWLSFLSVHHLGQARIYSVLDIVSKLAWGLGYFGQIHILVRFMAVRNPGALRQAKWIALFWMFVAMFSVVYLGMLGHDYFSHTDIHFNHQLVLVMLVKQFFSPLVYGVAIALTLSVIMSALAAQLLVTSSALSEDLYLVYLRPHAGKLELLWVSRCAVVLVALIAAGMAMDPNSSVFGMVAYAWSGLGASFGPVILISLLWRRITYSAAVAGMASGVAVVILWALAGHFFGGVFHLYELIPAFIVSTLVILIVSKCQSPPSQHIIDTFAQYEQKLAQL